MCGRYHYHRQKMIAWTDVLKDWPKKIETCYNVYPSSQVVAFRNETGEAMRWGMIPPWAKAFDSQYATHNARIETLENKPTFKNAWNKAQRCLMPMAGFYERHDYGDRQYHYCTNQEDGGLVVAGLFEQWRDNQLSCTMITKPSDTPLSDLHPRTPILLTVESAREWLSVPTEQAKEFLSDCQYSQLTIYPVNNRVGNTRNNDAGLVEPLGIE